ncbi:MAG: nucleotidyltransferase [Haliea sp.]|nr:nucleotidyltransferase [Haliea sp.]|tara:strand:+ start:171588 stop:171953 length:366 start_codon:yes stop_codon:yes gene_type:complete
MSETSRREWRFYLDDMISFTEKALTYTEGFDQTTFINSGLTYDATLRNLELIGEAAGHIPVAVREQLPEIPWRMIVATRNRLIHGYLGIDNDTLWSIIRDDLPELLPMLKTARNSPNLFRK